MTPSHRFATRPAWLRMLHTTVRGVCPACQTGSVFAGIYATRPVCAECGVAFERHAGNWTGPVVLAYGVATALAILLGLILIPRFGFTVEVELALIGGACASALVAYRPIKAWWLWLLWTTGVIAHAEPGSPREAR